MTLFFGGDTLAASLLQDAVGRIYTKGTNQTRASTTTLADDSELQGIPLGVGTWWVKLKLFFYDQSSATPDIKTQWSFTGTWTTPVRHVIAPGTSNAAGPTAITPMKLVGQTAAGDSIYGAGSGTSFYSVTEESLDVVVTAAGNLSLQWAQNTSDASNTVVGAGSSIVTRRVA